MDMPICSAPPTATTWPGNSSTALLLAVASQPASGQPRAAIINWHAQPAAACISASVHQTDASSRALQPAFNSIKDTGSQTESQIALRRPAPQRLIPISVCWLEDGGETDVRSDMERLSRIHAAPAPEPKRARRPVSDPRQRAQQHQKQHVEAATSPGRQLCPAACMN